MDAVGGEMNAFTAKEHTCYYANVLASDLPLAVTLLSDLVTEACNTADDLESERTVVLEEIAMRDDEPSDAVHDLFSETLFGDTPLGRSVLGTVESIEGLTRDDVDGWYRGRYAMPSIVVTAAGRVDHQQVLDLVTAAFGDRLTGEARPAPLRLGDMAPDKPARPAGLIARRTEQTHLLLGHAGHRPARRPPVRRGRARRRRRRRDELPPVPGDPGEARAGLQRRIGADPLRRHRRVLRLRRAARRSACPRCCGWSARSWPGSPPTGSPPRRSPARAASSRAASCSASRTPDRG